MDLGTKIRHRREQLGLSQADLAQLMHIAQGRISEWESGARTQMSLKNLRSLARALGVSADYLIGTWEDDAAPSPTAAAAPAGEGTVPARGRGRPRRRPHTAARP
jgi:transcriptional regulator with XRE-family HTH domain